MGALLAGLALLWSVDSIAQTPPSLESARKIYDAARDAYSGSRTNTTAAWEFARAAFDLADLATSDRERSRAANAGIEACRDALKIDPNSAPARFYLALNLGQLARTRKLSAFKLLREMERELLTARKLDPKFDYAGPDRSLGVLYLEAPSRPVSIGNRQKARTHLEAAVALAPNYPENRIYLAEAYARWAETENLERELRRLVDTPNAWHEFSSDVWTATRANWRERIEKLEQAWERLNSGKRVPSGERGARSRDN